MTMKTIILFLFASFFLYRASFSQELPVKAQKNLVLVANKTGSQLLFFISADSLHWGLDSLKPYKNAQYLGKRFIKIITDTIVIVYELFPDKYYFFSWNPEKNAWDLFEQKRDSTSVLSYSGLIAAGKKTCSRDANANG